MPIEIQELTDERMALLALEENLRRQDLPPMDVARAVEMYLTTFKGSTEVDLAKKLKVTQGHVSNMRRVVRLPDKILEAVDEGRINFTMARELCVFQGHSAGTRSQWSSKAGGTVKLKNDEEYLMMQAVRNIVKAGAEKNYNQEPATVDGIKRAVASVAKTNFKALERGNLFAGYAAEEMLFDTREAGCLKCESVIRAWPQKSTTAHYCTKPECWQLKQEAFKVAAAEKTKKKIQKDIVKKVAAAESDRVGKADISQEIPTPDIAEAAANQTIIDREAKQEAEHAEQRRQQLHAIPGSPCLSCVDIGRCDGTNVRAGNEEAGEPKLVCDNHTTKKDQPKLKEKATLEVPAEMRDKIKTAAGTRAEILDLRELKITSWGELKQGFAMLAPVLEEILDPDHCQLYCTKGFHYAFDSSPITGYGDRKGDETYPVCSNSKCLGGKKAAFTRAKNAKRNELKKAEAAAIKKAVAETIVIDAGRMRLILLAQIRGRHNSSYMYGTDKKAETWLWDKLSAGTPKEERKDAKLFEIIGKMDSPDLAKLVVELMLYYLKDSPDSEHYQARTKEPLSWVGIKVERPAKAAAK